MKKAFVEAGNSKNNQILQEKLRRFERQRISHSPISNWKKLHQAIYQAGMKSSSNIDIQDLKFLCLAGKGSVKIEFIETLNRLEIMAFGTCQSLFLECTGIENLQEIGLIINLGNQTTKNSKFSDEVIQEITIKCKGQGFEVFKDLIKKADHTKPTFLISDAQNFNSFLESMKDWSLISVNSLNPSNSNRKYLHSRINEALETSPNKKLWVNKQLHKILFEG